MFGLDPATHELEVNKKLANVPDYVEFYQWMRVRETLDYLASFRDHWNDSIERDLLVSAFAWILSNGLPHYRKDSVCNWH